MEGDQADHHPGGKDRGDPKVRVRWGEDVAKEQALDAGR